MGAIRVTKANNNFPLGYELKIQIFKNDKYNSKNLEKEQLVNPSKICQ
jgi:hypothetical protein